MSIRVHPWLGNSYFGIRVQGEPGDPVGPQGPPGDVSTTQLNDTVNAALVTAAAEAAANSCANTNGVALLDTSGFSDPPTLADLLAVANHQNEIVLALRR